MKKKYLKPEVEIFNFQSVENITAEQELGGNFQGSFEGNEGVDEW